MKNIDREYRIIKQVDRQKMAESAVSHDHYQSLITITVRSILKGSGPKERLGKVWELECSVTNINNDKAPDGLILIHGLCITFNMRFCATITREQAGLGYGILSKSKN